MTELPVFKCEAIKTLSEMWVLSKVKNDNWLFKEYEVFDGDYLEDNLYSAQLTEIEDDWTCIEFEIIVADDGDIDIYNLKNKKNTTELTDDQYIQVFDEFREEFTCVVDDEQLRKWGNTDADIRQLKIRDAIGIIKLHEDGIRLKVFMDSII